MPDDNSAKSATATSASDASSVPNDVSASSDTSNPAAAAAPTVSDQLPNVEAPNVATLGTQATDDDVRVSLDDPVASKMDGVNDIPAEVVKKIGDSTNVLIALSSDPSVDEMSAAIGLSLFLDKLGKRATAIYSGATPNALEFLKPEETFEPTVDTLQDFVIALNKEKADHLRYKLDGDFVKIYITPYRTRVSEEDLEFSYGDFNVDLVLALDVANGIDLDSALREHGRIMHDAVIVNITTGKPGKLGEIEWSDKNASSVSEMIAKLLYNVNGKAKIEKEEATAFLTGIVAATNRFSNAKTTPETMKISSRLMESGANQQLISKNITPDVENEMFNILKTETPKKTKDDPTQLEIEHESGRDKADDQVKEGSKTTGEEGEKEKEPEPEPEKEKENESTLLDDLKAAEASLATAGSEVAPEISQTPLKIGGQVNEDVEKTDGEQNPATVNAPNVPTNPEINGVPTMNHMPLPGEEILPPPPPPPIDTNNLPGVQDVPGAQEQQPGGSLGAQPAMQDQVYVPQAADPGAFKIPGA